MKSKSLIFLSTNALAFCAMCLPALQGVAADGGFLNPSDSAFVRNEAASGLAGAQLAELGVKKAFRPAVKTYALLLNKERAAANAELKNLAIAKGTDLSAVTYDKHSERLQTLEGFTGAEFDQKFLTAVLSGHENQVGKFETAIAESVDTDVKQWAAKMLPIVKKQVTQAQELSTEAPSGTNKEADRAASSEHERKAATLTPVDQGNSKLDLETTTLIRKHIIARDDMSVDAQNVKIITVAGKVTLRGAVSSGSEKRIIGEIAGEVATAGNVVNLLEVQGTAEK